MPSSEKEIGIEGRVFVQCWVEKDGALTEIECIHCISNKLEASTLKAIKAMPKWLPAKVNDEPVRVRMQIPILFKLD